MKQKPTLKIPQAVPAEEEEEKKAPAPPPAVQLSTPSMEPAKPAVPALEEGEDAGEEEIEEVKAAPVPRPGPIQRASKVLAPVLLVAALLFAANYFFDPFGTQENTPAKPAREQSAGELPRTASRGYPAHPADLDAATLGQKLEQMTVESYLGRLGEHRIFPARHPDGLFIGAAFVPVGSRLNPELGLTLKAVDDSGAVIEDEYFREYQLTFR